MAAIIDIVLPVFCLIGLGYLTVRLGVFSVSTGDALADFVFKLAVPVLLMRSIATAEFTGGNPWAFAAVYFFAIALSWCGAILLIRLIFNRGARAAVISGVAASFSNLVLLGIPLIERAYGAEGLQILLFLISIHLPVMMAVSTILMEYATRTDGVDETQVQLSLIAKNLFRNLAVNPIIIGIGIGLLWRFSGLGVSSLPAQLMELISQTTGPLALVSLGMGLIKYGIKGNLLPAFCLSALSLLFMPAIAYSLGIFALSGLWFKVVVLAAACPTGVNAYLFANYFKVAEGLATNTIVLALLGSVVTIPFWLSLT